ncbi:(2Fe-2S)-binding protein, partial [Streptomyces sp. 2MCAF27]
PPHGVAPVDGRGGFGDEGYDGHAGAGTLPLGVAPGGGRGGFVDDGADGYEAHDGPGAGGGPAGADGGHMAQATPPHGVVADADGPAPEAPQAPADLVQAEESAELALDGHGAPLAGAGAGVEADPSAEDVEAADADERPTAETMAPEAPSVPEAEQPTDPTDVQADPGTTPDAAETPQADSEHPSASYVLHVNGTDRPVTDAWIGESLLYVLRERLGLAGAKDGCSQGECGACSVQVDGRLVASCLVPAATAAGCEVRTVEGLAVDGQPSDVQRALAACGAVQCGFCVPGMAMTVHDLLEGNHSPTDLQTRQAISGNLCRCSGYRGVVNAVREVVAGREAAAAADAEEA